jgi:hypothetical protein
MGLFKRLRERIFLITHALFFAIRRHKKVETPDNSNGMHPRNSPAPTIKPRSTSSNIQPPKMATESTYDTVENSESTEPNTKPNVNHPQNIKVAKTVGNAAYESPGKEFANIKIHLDEMSSAISVIALAVELTTLEELK